MNDRSGMVTGAALLLVGLVLGFGASYLVNKPVVPTGTTEKFVKLNGEAAPAEGDGKVKAPKQQKLVAKPDVTEFADLSIQYSQNEGELWIGVNLKSNPKESEVADARQLLDAAFGLLDPTGFKKDRPDRDGRLLAQRWTKQNFEYRGLVLRIEALGDSRYRVISQFAYDRDVLSALLEKIEARQGVYAKWKAEYRDDPEVNGAQRVTVSPAS